MSTMLDWALYYASQGLSIIPVKGKTPLIKWKEFQERCASEEEIKAWWTQWPEVDIGCVTGKNSGRLVLDIDGPEGVMALEQYSIPITQSTNTKRGKQYHFKFPSGISEKTTGAGLFNQVDYRGEGGYVKLPPSSFSSGDGRYTWERGLESELADTPKWLIDLLTKQPERSTVVRQQGWIAEALSNLTDGTKHSQIVSILGRLRHDNYAKEDAFAFVAPYTREKGVSDEDVWTRIESVWGLYPAKEEPQSAESFTFKVNPEEYLKELEERGRKTEPDFPTGFTVLDTLTKGFMSQNLFVIGAPTNGGKTQLILSSIHSLLNKGRKVLYFSTEMPQSEIRDRFNALGADVPIDEITKGRLSSVSKEKLMQFVRTFDSSGFVISPTDRPTLENIVVEVEKVRPDVLILDHIHHIKFTSDNRRTEIDDFVMGLKKIALEKNIPVVVTAQLKRKDSVDGKPIQYTMHDFKESGGIENEAGVCLLLCPPNQWTTERYQSVTGYIPKNRHGRREVRFSLQFDTDIAKFSEL